MKNHLWQFMSNNTNNQIKNEAIESVHVGKIFHWWDGRNAWHSTWVQRYNNLDAFCATKETALSRIDASRVQGSVFYLQEFPVLIFMGKAACLLIGDMSDTSPLSKFKSTNFANTSSLHDAAEAFRPTKDSGIVKIISGFFPDKLDRTARYPGKKSVGGSAELDYWPAKNLDLHAYDMHEIRDSANSAIQEKKSQDATKIKLDQLLKKYNQS